MSFFDPFIAPKPLKDPQQIVAWPPTMELDILKHDQDLSILKHDMVLVIAE